MKIGIVGREVTVAEATAILDSYLAWMRKKHPKILTVITQHDDDIGRYVRSRARRLNIRRQTVDRVTGRDTVVIDKTFLSIGHEP